LSLVYLAYLLVTERGADGCVLDFCATYLTHVKYEDNFNCVLIFCGDGEQEGDAIGTAGSVVNNTTHEVAQVPGSLPPQPDHPGRGWYYNYEEDRYSFCEDTESEVTDDEEDKSG
jgi:hypothetical protein